MIRFKCAANWLAGSKLAITFLGYGPTIYSLADPYPVAVCSGRLRPDGSPVAPNERSYSNCCTIKVCIDQLSRITISYTNRSMVPSVGLGSRTTDITLPVRMISVVMFGRYHRSQCSPRTGRLSQQSNGVQRTRMSLVGLHPIHITRTR